MTTAADNHVLDTPHLWRMGLCVSDSDDFRTLDAVVFSTVGAAPLSRLAIPMDTAGQDSLSALEEAVYANPILLNDFGRTDILVRATRFVIVPDDPDASAETDHAIALSAGLLTDDISRPPVPGGYQTMSSAIPSAGVRIVYALPQPLAGFLRRTFPTARFHHHLAPLAHFFHAKSTSGNARKLFVHFHPGAGIGRGHADILSFGRDGTPTVLTTLAFACPMDAVYYILATGGGASFRPEADELMVSGDPELRKAIVPLLRKFVNYVMPVIFPSEVFRLGKEAIHAPFPLILIPLCE